LKIISLLSSFFVIVQVLWHSQKYDLLLVIRRFVISSEILLSPVTNEPRQMQLLPLSKMYLPVYNNGNFTFLFSVNIFTFIVCGEQQTFIHRELRTPQPWHQIC